MAGLERREAEHDHAAGHVGHEEDEAPVEPIGDDAGDVGEEHVGQDAGGPDDPRAGAGPSLTGRRATRRATR